MIKSNKLDAGDMSVLVYYGSALTALVGRITRTPQATLFFYIQVVYYRRRRHSVLGNLHPDGFQHLYYKRRVLCLTPCQYLGGKYVFGRRVVSIKGQARQFFDRFLGDFDEDELNNPDLGTVFELVWFSIKRFFVEKPGIIIGTTFVLIMLWGYHGNLELLRFVLPNWVGPGAGPGERGQILPGIPWDQELISFWGGALLLVVIPCLIIHFRFNEPLADYGLGLPPKGRRKLAVVTFFTLIIISLPAFWIGSKSREVQSVYPLFQGSFSNAFEFLLYELTYLPFFIAIEFIFRGYLLFGLAGVRDEDISGGTGGIPGKFYFREYALLIQMLTYTAWHLGKPIGEAWGTLVWGLPAGATAYACRSIWPIVIGHWLLNVFLDGVIVKPF
jgi:hypothetical protein